MNSRDRVLTALSNGQPDRVPVFDVIDEDVVRAVARILGCIPSGSEETQDWDRYCLVVDGLGLDATLSGPSRGIEPFGDDLVSDRFGCVFRTSEHGEPVIVDGPIHREADLEGYEIESKVARDDFAKSEYVIRRFGRDKAHFVSVPDPFKTSWFLRGGMQNLLLDYVENPGLVHALARMGTDLCLRVIEMAADAGADALFMGGDLASERMTLMSPEHFREYIKPYYEELVLDAHQRGLLFVKHTDGNLWLILDDFVDLGFDGFHPVQPQCMDIGDVKRHVAGRLCLLGNIDCRELLPFGTEEEVEEAVREAIAKAASAGGYVLCSSNSIHPGVRPENFIAMVRAAHQYGAYL